MYIILGAHASAGRRDRGRTKLADWDGGRKDRRIVAVGAGTDWQTGTVGVRTGWQTEAVGAGTD